MKEPISRRKHRSEDNIKTDLKKIDDKVKTYFVWLRIRIIPFLGTVNARMSPGVP
jgi:hypothetical protein